MKLKQRKIFVSFEIPQYILVVLVLLYFFVFTGQVVFAETVNKHNYVIQLKSASNLQDLKKIDSNPKRLFLFSSDPKFKNIYSFASDKNLYEVKKELKNNFEYIENNIEFQIQAVSVNDPGFTLNPGEAEKQWGLAKAGFPQVWDRTFGNKKNIVALIDTGVDATHEDLKTIFYVDGFNFITNQTIRGNVNSDDNGHGTMVAGILGATANNGIGISGANWEVSVMPLKALDSNGKGESSKIAQAIVWAVDQGASLINLSIGGIGLGHDTTLSNAITYAFNKNAVIVAAAGNDSLEEGVNLDTEPVFPICDDNGQNMIIGVTAVDLNDTKPSFANYGKNCVDVSAPGKKILSTLNIDPQTKQPAPNSYAYGSGTSLAVPFVVAQAALIRSLYPKANNLQVRDRIISTADIVDSQNLRQCDLKSCAGFLGFGRINVKKSLEEAITNFGPKEGELIAIAGNENIYEIVGGQKRQVSKFVLNQRFAGIKPKLYQPSEVVTFPEGSFANPNDGTLVRASQSQTVFFITAGKKMPVSSVVFKNRKYQNSDIILISKEELNSWPSGNFLTPKEGTIIRNLSSGELFWVINTSLHKINRKFIYEKGLQGFSYLNMNKKEIGNFSLGESYVGK